MSYIVDLSDGRSVFKRLENYERIRIEPIGKLFNVYVIDDRKAHERVEVKFHRCEKFTLVSDE